MIQSDVKGLGPGFDVARIVERATGVSALGRVGSSVYGPSPRGNRKGMQVLGLIIIGIVIGVLARLVLPGRQRIGAGLTVLLGIAGALVGGIVASALGTRDIWELNFLGTIVGIVAAVGLIGAADAAGLGSGGRRDALGPGR
jgi:uncharacterized membrane protein YeaQ/YmgE (transglycosylase-associated protein family)